MVEITVVTFNFAGARREGGINSEARAVSLCGVLKDKLGKPPDLLGADGFNYQPINWKPCEVIICYSIGGGK